MATFTATGINDLEQLLADFDESATKAVPLMIKEAAQVLIEAEQQEARSLGMQDTGGFINSIKATAVKVSSSEKYVLVYPDGTAPHGSDYGGGKSLGGDVRYATIGAIAENGTSKQAARPWFSVSNEKAADDVNAKMAEVWEVLVHG